MGLTFWVNLLLAVATIAGVMAIMRHNLRPRERKVRGAEPGEGDTLVFAQESAGFSNPGNADATGRVIRVTNDPQQYARAFVPSNRRNAK